MQQTNLSEQELIRREKLAEMIKAGIEPYPASLYPVNSNSINIKQNFSEADREQYADICIAGRIMSVRDMGKANFAVIQDSVGKIQIYIRRDDICPGEDKSLYDLTNDSINQTMSRTIVTNGLVFLSVLALVLFGGEVLRGFSLALFVGSITGTYSTIAIASPIAIWWQDKLGAAKVKDVQIASQSGEKMASASRRSVTRRPVTR